MTGEADRLLRHALHQTAVAGDDIGVVLDQVGAESRVPQALAKCHADRGCDALTKRASGCLDAGRVPVFGMASRLRAELTEILDVIQRHAGRAGQIQRGV